MKLDELKILTPSVSPIEGGGYQLNWNYGDRHIEVEYPPFNPKEPIGEVGWLADDETGQMVSEDLPWGKAHEKITQLLRWLLSGGDVKELEQEATE